MRRAAPPAGALLATLVLSAPLRADDESERVVIQYTTPVTCGEAAEQTGLVPLAELPGEGTMVMLRPDWMPDWLFKVFTWLLDWNPTTVFAEGERRVGLPELDGCTVDVSAWAIQQCSVGFVSGNGGEADAANQVWLTLVNATAAQGLAQGDAPVIAVIDTGVDPNHPALAGRLAGDGWDYVLGQPGGWDLPDGADDDGDGYVDEAFGHGTHVAGTILAVHPGARILPYRVLDADGNGWSFDVACAIWRAFQDGADFINLSLGMVDPRQVVTHRLGLALEGGVEVFTSAGNTGAEWVLYPGTLGVEDSFMPWTDAPAEGVVSVGAVDGADLLAPFSAWGPAVDFVAPGVKIHGPIPGGGYASWDGTSMAAAVACGAAALVRSVGGDGVGTAASHLAATATPVDSLNPDQAGGLGAGRIDVLAACLSALAGPVEGSSGAGGGGGPGKDEDQDEDEDEDEDEDD